MSSWRQAARGFRPRARQVPKTDASVILRFRFFLRGAYATNKAPFDRGWRKPQSTEKMSVAVC